MLCLDVKLALLRTHTADLRVPDLDRVKGRLLHYSAAIRHLRIRVTEMQRLMGPQSRAGLAEAELPSAYAPTASDHYDQLSPLPAGLSELAAEMDYILPSPAAPSQAQPANATLCPRRWRCSLAGLLPCLPRQIRARAPSPSPRRGPAARIGRAGRRSGQKECSVRHARK